MRVRYHVRAYVALGRLGISVLRAAASRESWATSASVSAVFLAGWVGGLGACNTMIGVARLAAADQASVSVLDEIRRGGDA
jgi:hypothetical protein